MRNPLALVLLSAAAFLTSGGASAQADSTGARPDREGMARVVSAARAGERTAFFLQLDASRTFITPTLNVEQPVYRGYSVSAGVGLSLQALIGSSADSLVVWVPLRVHAPGRIGTLTTETGLGVYTLFDLDAEAGEPTLSPFPFAHFGVRFADGRGAAFRMGVMVLWDIEDASAYPAFTLAVATDR